MLTVHIFILDLFFYFKLPREFGCLWHKKTGKWIINCVEVIAYLHFFTCFILLFISISERWIIGWSELKKLINLVEIKDSSPMFFLFYYQVICSAWVPSLSWIAAKLLLPKINGYLILVGCSVFPTFHTVL